VQLFKQLLSTVHAVRITGRHRLLGLGGVLLGLSLSGCTNFVDDVTAVSPEGGFWNNLRYRRELIFSRPAPLDVLAKSQDGDMRARAYRALQEPRPHGGSDEDQTRMIELLATAAKSERDLICRLAATEKLGEFKDGRAHQALSDAFYAPANFQCQDPVVRVAAIQGMAKVSDPAAAQTLAEAVARDPARDVRLAAAEGLGRFQSYQATTALVKVLKEEKDVALRYQAAESLKQITGKDLPPQADQWEQYIQGRTGPDQQITREPSNKSLLQQVMFWEK
jgi:HEAT repeat protein